MLKSKQSPYQAYKVSSIKILNQSNVSLGTHCTGRRERITGHGFIQRAGKLITVIAALFWFLYGDHNAIYYQVFILVGHDNELHFSIILKCIVEMLSKVMRNFMVEDMCVYTSRYKPGIV